MLNRIDENQTLGEYSHYPYMVAIARAITIVDLNQTPAKKLPPCAYQVGHLVYAYYGNAKRLKHNLLLVIKTRMPVRYHRLLAAALMHNVNLSLLKEAS